MQKLGGQDPEICLNKPSRGLGCHLKLESYCLNKSLECLETNNLYIGFQAWLPIHVIWGALKKLLMHGSYPPPPILIY